MTEVVAALIWDGGKFMICQRPEHKARGLLWEFVGGKVGPGETKEQALARECREELGWLPKKKNKTLPENNGKPWTNEDEDGLCKMFDSGTTRKELCKSFKRTPGAKASRLVRIGKLRNADQFWREQSEHMHTHGSCDMPLGKRPSHKIASKQTDIYVIGGTGPSVRWPSTLSI